MPLRYVDTSALVRCYLDDEPDHDELRTSLLEGAEPVLTSELIRVELASAMYAAGRAGRLENPARVIGRIDAHCAENGPIALVQMRPESVFPMAIELLARFPLRALDAMHLAVAQSVADLADDEPVVLVSRGLRQREAAAALGMPVE